MGAKVVKTKNVVAKTNGLSNSNSSNKLNVPSKKQSSSTVSKYASPLKSMSAKVQDSPPETSTRGGPGETCSAFNPNRLANKKQKININQKGMESSELDVLSIKKKNNHDFEDKELIDNCLMKHFFMRSLDKDSRVEIIKEMSLCSVDKDTAIFKQGSMGNFFYIIKEGDLDLFINDNYTKTLKKGESFGELALLHGAPRSGTVKTKTNCLLWCLERRNFRKVMDHINLINFEENMKFINSIPILTNIDNDLKSVLASNLLKEFFEAAKYIVRGKLFYNFRW
jgi:CRP-like cAMP-binding protein